MRQTIKFPVLLAIIYISFYNQSSFILTKKTNIMQSKFVAGTLIKQSLIIALFIVLFSCKKGHTREDQPQLVQSEAARASKAEEPHVSYNLEIVLRGEGNQSGHIHFRQDRDAAKIITLDIKVHHLNPNHEIPSSAGGRPNT